MNTLPSKKTIEKSTNSHIYCFNGNGGATETTLEKIADTKTLYWAHLDYTDKTLQTWLQKKSGLDEVIAEALMATETRPRTFLTQKGILLILRSINQTPKSHPEDMISIRLWIEEHRIISTSRRNLNVVQEMVEFLQKGSGPTKIADFLDMITERIATQIEKSVDQIDIEIDELESAAMQAPGHSLRLKLIPLRRRIVALRRYVSPQREALGRLAQIDRFTWINESDRFHLMETYDDMMRCIEDLDEARDRSMLIQEILTSRISERVEKRMYILSMVAAIFLPLSFVTGLLGMNVAGIPGAAIKWAFPLVSLLLVLVGIIEYWFFKKRQWL